MKIIKSILIAAIICYVTPIALLSYVTFEIQYLWIGDWHGLARAVYLAFVFIGSFLTYDLKHNGGKETAKAIRDSNRNSKRGALR